MRMRTALAVTALVLAGALALRALSPERPAPSSSPRARQPPAPARRPAPPAPAPVAVPERDIFDYAAEDEPPADGDNGGFEAAPPLPAPPSLAEPSPPAAEGPRVVGLVHRGGVLKAALAVDGDVFVVGVGERAGRYLVTAVDEEVGVQLTDEAGQPLRLSPPR